MNDQTITDHLVTASLDQGGMGEVYRATHTKLGREVAIKVRYAKPNHREFGSFRQGLECGSALPNLAALVGTKVLPMCREHT